ncbi:MAG: heparan-alpha-glucosaminide N-acetyltransferase [Candidatus Micrarchaeota archaeon]
MKRILEIDALRGVAIVLMIIYHFLFDLNFFGIVNIDIHDTNIVIFQRTIAILFIGLVGISITLSENRNKRGYLSHFWRGLKLVNIAILITAATWIFPHDGFITFGIIHMIALSTFIAPAFFKLGKWNFLVGLGLVSLGIWLNTLVTNSRFFFWLGLPFPEYFALDYYPMLPWFGVILIGMAIGQAAYHKNESRFKIKDIGLVNKLVFLGKNSLVIYLVHQVVLVGLIITYLYLK